MERKNKLAEVQYTSKGDTTIVELIVPHGTRLLEALKAQEAISKELLPKIAPRSCQACISGADFRIKERLENVIRVDLEEGRLLD